MKSEVQNRQSAFEILRRQAEDVLRENIVTTERLPSRETKHLIHELRVHQIELEIQNEELRRTQRELETARDRYSDLYDFAPVGYFTVEKDGVILEVNLSGAAMLGVERGELVGEKMSGFIHREDQDVLYRHRRQVLATQERQICELRMIKRDGTQFNARLESIVVLDKSGDLTSYRTVVSDVTEQTRLIKQIRKDKEEWERTFDAIDDIVTIQDPKMRVVRINQAGSMIFHVRPEEVVGKLCYEVFRGEPHPCEGCPAVHTMHDFTSHSTEIEHSRLGKTFLVTAAPILDERKEFIGIVHTAKDITAQKTLEAQLRQAQKIEALGTLAGGIAHDFNNILAAILGFADMAKREVPKNSQLHDDLLQVIKAGLRAKDLVSQILVFSRRNKTQKEPVQINLIVKEVFKLLRATLPLSIEIRANVTTERGKILADPSQIHQVLMNLCINAYHAMEEQGGIIDVELGETDLDAGAAALYPDMTPGPYIQLSVSDTGHGIEHSVLERIFEPFFTTKETGKGTGMGLSVVYGIVRNHGGAITVDSKPGKGTTFHLFFPKIETGQDREASQEIVLPPRGNERILFVDDEKSLIKLTKQMLEHLGYDVVVEMSSIKALELFRARPDAFDLVITDQAMPKMTGTELARELLQLRPDLPIILCTGFNQAVKPEKVKHMGLREVIMKPFLTSELAAVVRKVLDNEAT